MENATYYLNNSGSRWRNYINGKPEKVNVFDPKNQTAKPYSVSYWEAIGNFAVPFVKIKGRIEQLLAWTHEGFEAWAINNEENRNRKFPMFARNER